LSQNEIDIHFKAIISSAQAQEMQQLLLLNSSLLPCHYPPYSAMLLFIIQL
jgi:hypothetical protein